MHPISDTAPSAALPVRSAAAVAEPVRNGALRLESIVQKELAYYQTLTPALLPVITEANLDSCDKRLAALGRELLYITNPCAIGDRSLADFRRAYPDASMRGRELMAALPAPEHEKFVFGSLAYQTLLTNACFPDRGTPAVPTEHTAVFLTQASTASTP